MDQVFDAFENLPEVKIYFTHGHLADGNIHFLVGKSNGTTELIKKVNDIVYGPLKHLEGTVSAEHGIGVHKKEYLQLSRSTEEIELMRLLKVSLNSRGILNRGKIIDA